MKVTIIHRNHNPFTTSALRGGRLRKSGGSVASSLAFLTGMTALVLGVMFALSTPSFATDSVGIDVFEPGDEDIVIADTGAAAGRASHIGVRANHSGAGSITINNNWTNLLYWKVGIRASHSDNGNIKITNQAEYLFGFGKGMHVDHSSTGNIEITNKGGIMLGGHLPGYGPGIGIHAEHSGMGNIVIDNQGDSGSLYAILAFHTGIRADHSGTGDIDITVDDGRSVKSTHSHGIEAIHTGTGTIGIDLSGYVQGGDGTAPISMTSAGTKTLVLRPGFGLSSRNSWDHSSAPYQNRRVNIISAGAGDGILRLDENDDPEGEGPYASETLDFEDFSFQGFNKFEKDGENTWKIRGDADDTEKFDSATISRGGLRFMGDVTFKMSEPEAATDPKHYFKIESAGVLEVVERNNVLEGNLDNLGNIVFTQDAEQNTPTTLAVKGDYKGGGTVVFHAGSNGWRADKLKIEGSKDSTDNTQVSVKREDSNFDFDSRENETLPMVIEVEGEVAVTSVWGIANVDIHQYYLDPTHDFDDVTNEITMHRWQFRRGVELSTLSRTSLNLEENLTQEVDTEEEVTLNPDEENTELGLRASVHGQSGGVWGRQQSLRTSKEPSLIASRGSRKEGHRVHFGYDTPAMGFMGGDMVVRTSVSRGLSVSDAFSSSDRSRINMESNAAALTALWQSPSGFYAGGGTRYVRSSSNLSADDFAMARDNDGVGVGASAKAGYRFAVPLGGMDFSVASQVQLLWSRVDFDDFVGLNGEVVSLEDGDLMTGRLGLSWNGEWRDIGGSGRIYGKMSLHNALDGETTVSVSGIPLSRERDDLSTDGKLGLSYEWDEGYAVRGEVSALHRDNAEEVRADLSMSLDF